MNTISWRRVRHAWPSGNQWNGSLDHSENIMKNYLNHSNPTSAKWLEISTTNPPHVTAKSFAVAASCFSAVSLDCYYMSSHHSLTNYNIWMIGILIWPYSKWCHKAQPKLLKVKSDLHVHEKLGRSEGSRKASETRGYKNWRKLLTSKQIIKLTLNLLKL